MSTIAELKELSTTETPLFLVVCELASGAIERWSTHRVQAAGEVYEPRILRHNLFDIRSDADEGVDNLSRVSITLANTDSHCSQIERSIGWKGAKVTVKFLFHNLMQDTAASETTVVFRGVANSPDETTENTMRLTVSNRLNLQRLLLPDVRIQRRCPWKFPANAQQRSEAVTGGLRGKYSPFFRCGYSADVLGGTGNLSVGIPFISCDYTRSQCEERGMFNQDSSGNPTLRFGGIEFVPPTILVRSYGEKTFHASPLLENESRYNDFVPIVYGTGWYAPPIVFARNDGNLTRVEILLGMGEIEDVLKVVVNDTEIPLGRAGADMTATGWYNVVSHGDRTGSFNTDFQDANGNPAGDPYGSMAVLSLVVPNRINDGKVLPRVQVLLHGVKLPRYDSNGAYLGDAFDNNPAWIVLDLLRRSGWNGDEIDLGSFAAAAAYCGELIQAQDLYGNPVLVPRFQCNLVLRKRRSAAELIRGIRNACRLYLTLGADGRLQLRVENTMALQQPSKPAGSNSQEALDGGWPCYEFGDGTLGISGILRKESGEPAIRLWTRSTADTPNRFSVEFQDAFNEYQQDSLSLVDVDDVLRTGHEVSVPLNALGFPNFHQAARVIQLQLDKSIRGNTYVEFETSVRGVGLKPGDLITLTYLKEGLFRQPFRIKSISPGMNYRTALITAQIHDDGWYTDDIGGVRGNVARRQPGFEVGVPRPLLGNVLDADGEPQFEIQERADETADGQMNIWLTVGFIAPTRPGSLAGSIPMLDLSPTISDMGGTLRGDQTLYYAVSATGGDGSESPLSFLVRATIPPGTDTNSVQLARLSFAPGTTAFHVYRGKNPVHLLRIASNQPVTSEFIDSGLSPELATAPDENYDHANFYWRLELQPEFAATIHAADAIGNETLQMAVNAYRGMTVRITRGKGAGQERPVLANDATTLTVSPAWSVEPDATSDFVVADSSWHFGAMGRTSPVEFEVPNRVGATVHVSGRSANVNNKECAYELSPLTRWQIGGAGAVPLDADVPGKPVYGLHPAGRGTVELLGVGFEDLVNTRTISAATLTLNYWPELSSPSQILLSNAIAPADTFIDLSSPGSAQQGSLIQVDLEIMRVNEVTSGGLRYEVERGVHGSAAETHSGQAPVYHLKKKVFIIPFARDFFGSPYSGSYSYPIFLPDVRIASAEMFVTNMRGNSEQAVVCYTPTVDAGLRTLSGGQLSIQVEGYLAIQSDVAPPLVIEETHAVHDVFAVVREAPAGAPIELQLRQNAQVYCTLTIPAGATVSNVVYGFVLPPLASGSHVNLDILSVGQAASGSPGRDLTVTIRL